MWRLSAAENFETQRKKQWLKESEQTYTTAGLARHWTGRRTLGVVARSREPQPFHTVRASVRSSQMRLGSARTSPAPIGTALRLRGTRVTLEEPSPAVPWFSPWRTWVSPRSSKL